MSSNNSNDICKASNIHECSHFEYVDPSNPDVDKGEKYNYLGVQLPPQFAFYVQKIADEQFPSEHSNRPHPGKKSKVLEAFIKHGINRYREAEKKGTFKEILEGEFTESGSGEDVLKDKLQSKKKTIKALRRKKSELRDELNELKKEHNIVKDQSDIYVHIVDLIQEQPLTVDQVVEKLREEKDVEFKKYEEPFTGDDIGLRGLTNHFLMQMSEENKIEVNRKNGRTVYEA